MKRLGRHPEKALTALQVRALNEPGRYADGNGLYLIVDRSGAKRWLLRTVVQGRRRDIGLGGVSLVTLAEARDAALSHRKLARAGGDPLAERRRAKAATPTFAEAAELVHAEHKASWENEKHAGQWINTLRTYANPHIGTKKIDQISTPDILAVLAPIWLTKAETARRVRQRLGTVFDWAKAAGHLSSENPVGGVAKGLPRQTTRVTHHAALPYAQIPAFIQKMHGQEMSAITALAFEFLVLTAMRTSEVLGARWDEFDESEQVWTVPPERMKKRREHRVPLSARAAEILALARQMALESPYVFPGRDREKPLSNMTFEMVLRRMKIDVTAHGFRSSFRDWAAEKTSYSREVAEAALAHVIENRTEAAYRRGDLLAKRRQMMDEWDSFCRSEHIDHGGKESEKRASD